VFFCVRDRANIGGSEDADQERGFHQRDYNQTVQVGDSAAGNLRIGRGVLPVECAGRIELVRLHSAELMDIAVWSANAGRGCNWHGQRYGSDSDPGTAGINDSALERAVHGMEHLN